MNKPMPSAPPPAYLVLATLVGLGGLAATPAKAQYLQTYFPSTVPGYNQELGVTVLSRLRPEYESQGVHVGSFTIRPELDETLGYDSNPVGVPGGPKSWLVQTAPSITANSDWSNAQLGGALSATNYRYLDTSNQNRTDWTAALGGGITLRNDDNLSIAYSHLSLHESAYDVGGIASTLPTPYQVEDFRIAYKADFGRFTLTPNIEAQHFQFDPTQIGNTPVSQGYRDRNVLTVALTSRYALTDHTGALLVLAGSGSNYTDPVVGLPSNNSRSVLVLVGLDNILGGLLRYRILVGGEVRTFSASEFSTHTAPVAEASLIWTPTGLTTVTGDLAQTIEDPSSEGTAGFDFTTATLVVDHEYQRNILLQARSILQHAKFLQTPGDQTAIGAGGGITYLVNRHIQVALNYDYLHQSGANPGNFAAPGVFAPTTLGSVSTGSFQRHLVLLSVKFAI